MDGHDLVRIACGLFLLPHFVLKIPRLRTLHEFYVRAKLPLPRVLAPIGFAVEGAIVASLLTDTLVFYGAVLGVAFMLVASYAVVRLYGGGKWRWEKQGPEYPLFLAVMLAIVAAEA